MASWLKRLTSVALLAGLLGAIPASAQYADNAAYVAAFQPDIEAVATANANTAEHAVLFTCQCVLCHGDYITHASVTDAVLEDYIDACKEAGFRRVEMNPILVPWQDTTAHAATVTKYTNAVAYTRTQGLQVSFSLTVTSEGGYADDLTETQTSTTTAITELASRYTPHAFSVGHEPTTMVARLGFSIGAAAFTTYITTNCATLATHAPSARCAAALLPTEVATYLGGLTGIAGLHKIGLDLYGTTDPASTITTIRNAGKQPYIAETWRTAAEVVGGTLTTGAGVGIGEDELMPLDLAWVRAMTLLASDHALESLTFFWTFPFFTYAVSGNNNATSTTYALDVVAAVTAGARTPVYRAVKALIGQWGWTRGRM